MLDAFGIGSSSKKAQKTAADELPMFNQLEQRRAQLVFAEKTIGAFEGHISELKQ